MKQPTRDSIPGTAIQVCVDYAELIAHSLRINRPLFDRFIVVTTPDDVDTQELCRGYDTEVVATDCFWRDDAFFNKAAGLNEGLRRAATDIVCSVDADTILPLSLPRHIAHVSDRESLYGMGRKIHLTYEDYLSDTGEIRATAPGYTIGFFQLFWRSSAFFPGEFAESYRTAAHYDVEFMAHWPVNQRMHLNGLLASHLGQRQLNWFGRRARDGSKTSVVQATTRAGAAHERFIGKITALRSSRQLLIQNVGRQPGADIIIEICTESDSTQLCLGAMLGGGFVEVPVNLTGRIAKATLHWSDSDATRCHENVPINFR
jgi:hypothetical protein